MIDEEIAANIELAKTRINEAERALDAALAAIQGAPRSAKVTVSQVVEGAFDRLRTARALLVSLEKPDLPTDEEESS